MKSQLIKSIDPLNSAGPPFGLRSYINVGIGKILRLGCIIIIIIVVIITFFIFVFILLI
jgi:hypothetical protein